MIEATAVYIKKQSREKDIKKLIQKVFYYDVKDSKARFKSAIRSSQCSTPTQTRMISSGKSREARTSAGIEACDISHGQDIREWTDPNETVI
mmetsp:Transcript_12000/g.16237  ORF Transcript_12000/g.16237 Transcript_12000/m.16237 type:complete len:92 (-) Transcript_12000:1116-1391(-)